MHVQERLHQPERRVCRVLDQPRSTQNGYAESFHGRLRDELLNAEVFADVREARSLAASWHYEYNHCRPHSSLKYLPPAAFAARLAFGLAVPAVGAPPLPPARPASHPSTPMLTPRLS